MYIIYKSYINVYNGNILNIYIYKNVLSLNTVILNIVVIRSKYIYIFLKIFITILLI